MDEKEVIRRLFEDVLNGGELAMLDELIAHDFEEHDAFSGQPRGSKGVKEKIYAYRQAFPDAHFEIEAMVGERGLVAVLYRMEGTQDGQINEYESTRGRGARITVQGMDFYRIEDGMIAEHWDCTDQAALRRRLSAAPGIAA